MPKTSVYKDYSAYYVEIIPKKSKRYDECFTPSDRQTGTACSANELIRQIDGMSFYELVTGEKDALLQVFDALPKVIRDCSVDGVMLDKARASDFFREAFGE